MTNEGVDDAVAGADVIIEVSNSPSFADDDVMNFLTTATTNLTTAATRAGVKHYVALSVVGCDRLPDSGYLRAKVAQEKLIAESGIAYCIVRATQFYEFGKAIADSSTVGDEVHVPPAYFQPMAADDVAGVVARTSIGEPVNGVIETGAGEGPDERLHRRRPQARRRPAHRRARPAHPRQPRPRGEAGHRRTAAA